MICSEYSHFVVRQLDSDFSITCQLPISSSVFLIPSELPWADKSGLLWSTYRIIWLVTILAIVRAECAASFFEILIISTDSKTDVLVWV